MNLVLLMLVIAQGCLGICTWLSPQLLRRIAAHLLTRADVIDASRVETTRRLRFWSGELGLNEQHTEEKIDHPLPRVHEFARR